MIPVGKALIFSNISIIDQSSLIVCCAYSSGTATLNIGASIEQERADRLDIARANCNGPSNRKLSRVCGWRAQSHRQSQRTNTRSGRGS